jgi:hypothetical protein
MAWSLLPQSPNSFNWTWVIELIVCILVRLLSGLSLLECLD